MNKLNSKCSVILYGFSEDGAAFSGSLLVFLSALLELVPGDDDDKAEEEVIEEEEEVDGTSAEETDWAAEVRKAVSQKKREESQQNVSAKTDNESKKRAADDNEKSQAKKAKAMKSQVSVPPKGKKKTKNSTNAKISKPRRRKAPVEM